MTQDKKKLLDLPVIQGLVCFLIPFWGAAMIVGGLIERNFIWMILGLLVMLVSLPFARNVLRNNGSSDERRIFS